MSRPLTGVLTDLARRRGASTSRWGNLEMRGILDSTQVEAARLEAAGAPGGTVVVARGQTGGRGRRGRTWISHPDAGLFLTALVRPGADDAWSSSPACFSLAAAIACCDASRSLGAIDAELKWPNDVLCRGAKLAGILVETRTTGERLRAVLIGIGVNLAGTPPPLPAGRATNLEAESGAAPAHTTAAAAVLDALDAWLAPAEAGDITLLAAAFEERSPMTRGAPVLVHEEGRAWKAVTQGLDCDGALAVRTEAGEARSLRLSEEISIREETACCS